MKSEYFVDIDEAKAFTFYLKFKDIDFTIIEHKLMCTKFKVVYMVYEIKYEGDL